MLAVKHLDPVLGVDIHFIITPPGAVVPIPHPHIGIVFDPFDYLPLIGATVKVNGLPRAQAGTGGRTLPPHFPICCGWASCVGRWKRRMASRTSCDRYPGSGGRACAGWSARATGWGTRWSTSTTDKADFGG